MLELLLAPLSYGFMQRGLLASVIVGGVCAIIGCYVILRSLAFLGDALAHAVLPGVALAYLLGVNLTMGALVAAIAIALGVGFFSRQEQLKEDTAIGILFAAALALGIVLISRLRTYAVDLTHILFGNVLGVSQSDLWLTALLGITVVLIVRLAYKPFLLVAFDPVLAATLRLRVEFYRSLLLVLLAVTIVVALQTVGVGLAVAMLVTPSATAQLVTRRLPTMMIVAAILGIAACVMGLYLSYYLNIASGAAAVLIATLFFVGAFLFAPRRGWLWQWRHFR